MMMRGTTYEDGVVVGRVVARGHGIIARESYDEADVREEWMMQIPTKECIQTKAESIVNDESRSLYRREIDNKKV
jgi:hypothetical protein